jgi:phosphoglycolate phosphatase
VRSKCIHRLRPLVKEQTISYDNGWEIPVTEAALKLVVFDCDGTLVDSQYNIIHSMHQAFSACQLPLPENDAVRRVIGLNLEQAIQMLMDDGKNEVLLDRLVANYKQAFFDHRHQEDHDEPLFEGTVELLEKLDAANIQMAVATGKSLRGLKAVIDLHGLHKYFTSLQTPDHNPGKPHPQMLEKAMAMVGADPGNTFMVGDTSFDMMLARNAGCHGVGVSWGYHDEAELRRTGADHMIDRFSALFPIVTDM